MGAPHGNRNAAGKHKTRLTYNERKYRERMGKLRAHAKKVQLAHDIRYGYLSRHNPFNR